MIKNSKMFLANLLFLFFLCVAVIFFIFIKLPLMTETVVGFVNTSLGIYLGIIIAYEHTRKKYYGKPFTPDILKDGNFELRVAKNDNNSYDNPSFYEIWQPGKQDDSRIVADWGNQFFHDIPRDIFPVYVWIGTKIVKTKQDSKIHIERFRTIELLWDELLDDLKTKKAVKRQYEVSVYKKGDKKTKTEKAKA